MYYYFEDSQVVLKILRTCFKLATVNQQVGDNETQIYCRLTPNKNITMVATLATYKMRLIYSRSLFRSITFSSQRKEWEWRHRNRVSCQLVRTCHYRRPLLIYINRTIDIICVHCCCAYKKNFVSSNFFKCSLPCLWKSSINFKLIHVCWYQYCQEHRHLGSNKIN